MAPLRWESLDGTHVTHLHLHTPKVYEIMPPFNMYCRPMQFCVRHQRAGGYIDDCLSTFLVFCWFDCSFLLWSCITLFDNALFGQVLQRSCVSDRQCFVWSSPTAFLCELSEQHNYKQCHVALLAFFKPSASHPE